MQTKDEVLRIFDEFGRNFMPPRLLQTEKNSLALLKHVLDSEGVVSISGLQNAAKALEGQLDWEREKTQREIFLEKQAKEKERLRRDQRENQPLAPKDYKELPDTPIYSAAEAARRTEQDRKDAKSQKQIGELISSYLPTKNGQIDYARQSEEAAKLRAAVQQCVKRGENWQSIAQKVAAKIQELYETAEKAQQNSTAWFRG